MRKPIEFAKLEWDDRGQPRSRQYNDIYFFSSEHSQHNTQHNGLEESRYVFLQNNHLERRWKNLKEESNNKESFVIAETGFGTGLNFLATWQLWDQVGVKDTWLHYFSFEKHPLLPSQLKTTLSLWPDLQSYSEQLLRHYPSLLSHGFYSIQFPDSKIMLTLIIDDIKAGLNQCLQSTHPWYSLPFGRGVDAWFLDGFAPRLNPDMWAVDVFERIAQLSHSQTTLATFTAVGEVQRQLKASGFVLEKVSGFANKREMLRGLFHPRDTKSDKSPIERRIKRPIPWSVLPLPTNSNKAIVIIGAGLAGCHSARALADCGWQVELLESSGQIADGGSGNAQGVVYAKLSVDDDALAQFNLNALLVAEQCYQPLWQRHPKLGQACGVLQLASNEKELRVWQQCLAYFDHQSFDYQGQSEYASAQFLNPKQASELAGTSLDVPALYFPVLGWVNPQALCRHLIDHPNIKVTTRCQIDSLAWDDGEYCWQLLDEHSQILRCSEQVLIANAYNASQFFQTRELPLKKIRGQVSYLSGSDCIDKINTVICGERYIAPLFETATGKQQSVGATFNLHYQQLDIRQQDHRDNIDGIVALLPGLASQLQDIDQSRLTGRASFRCTTPDYLPIVGPVHRHRAFVEDYGKLRVNANTSVDTLGQYWPGLTINVGHGSRGLAYTPLCARLLAAQINGDPLPVSRSLMQALHPGRFTLRALIRRQI